MTEPVKEEPEHISEFANNKIVALLQEVGDLKRASVSMREAYTKASVQATADAEARIQAMTHELLEKDAVIAGLREQVRQFEAKP